MISKAGSKYSVDFILFGTLGDLSCRKLLPALYQLECANLLHEESRIIGCAKEDLSLSAYCALVKTKIMPQGTLNEDAWARLQAKLAYCQLDLTESTDYLKLEAYTRSERIPISYFAIPPFLYAQVCQALSRIGLTKQPCRLVLEKPIGQDLTSSIEINNEVARYFAEDQIYRIDHYLGKETVLNLLVLRFANSVFSADWDHRVIDKVEITVAEEVGVEGRWNYYDNSGQVRDMLQNHLLQILSLVAMDPPLSLSAESIRSEKLKVLKALRPFNADNVLQHTVRAQYISGIVNGQKVPGYLEEEGANPNSTTETFVGIKAFIDNWRWSGVPFHLLTGKKLAKKQSEVVIHFKAQPHNIFSHIQKELTPNQLIIRLQPDEGVELRIMNKIPGLNDHMQLHGSKLDLNFNHIFNTHRIADAYERLLLEVMQGNQYLFVSREEVEEAWKWIDGIKDAWEQHQAPLYSYPSGTWGPAEVVQLFNGRARIWDEHHEIS